MHPTPEPAGAAETPAGYEYKLALAAAAVAVVHSGPGAPSVDRALRIEARGNGWTLAALAAGAAGSAVAPAAA